MRRMAKPATRHSWGWLCVLLLGSAGCGQSPQPNSETAPLAEPAPLPARPLTIVYKGEFPRNSNLQAVLGSYGFSAQDLHRLITDTRPVYNLHRVRAGNRYVYETDPGGSFHSFRYEIDDEKYFRAVREGDGFSGQIVHYPLETEVARLSGFLQDSLWNTLLQKGETPELVVLLAEIMQWDVDFTAIQAGDWFKLIVEKKYKEGQFSSYGRILAVQFNSRRKDFYGFLFQTPGTTKEHHYDVKGQSLRKAFLKVPFRFSPRISSGFSYSRLHPILKKRRAHPALDFAAPRGTPVLASARGRVVFAGVNGGVGKLVKIRHFNGFTTSYAHLSKIQVRSGQRVEQGQLIGKVGSTGLATASHLDYRIQDPRGRYLNPRKRIAWPSDRAVDKRHWSEFTAVTERFLAELEAIPLELPKDTPAVVAD